jgi:DNA polymerase III alpha subunit (gram-positive type)
MSTGGSLLSLSNISEVYTSQGDDIAQHKATLESQGVGLQSLHPSARFPHMPHTIMNTREEATSQLEENRQQHQQEHQQHHQHAQAQQQHQHAQAQHQNQNAQAQHQHQNAQAQHQHQHAQAQHQNQHYPKVSDSSHSSHSSNVGVTPISRRNQVYSGSPNRIVSGPNSQHSPDKPFDPSSHLREARTRQDLSSNPAGLTPLSRMASKTGAIEVIQKGIQTKKKTAMIVGVSVSILLIIIVAAIFLCIGKKNKKGALSPSPEVQPSVGMSQSFGRTQSITGEDYIPNPDLMGGKRPLSMSSFFS